MSDLAFKGLRQWRLVLKIVLNRRAFIFIFGSLSTKETLSGKCFRDLCFFLVDLSRFNSLFVRILTKEAVVNAACNVLA